MNPSPWEMGEGDRIGQLVRLADLEAFVDLGRNHILQFAGQSGKYRAASFWRLGRNDGRSGIGARSARKPLASASSWCRLHGDDRQPAIWLDLFRQSDEGRKQLGPGRNPGGV